MVAKDQKERKEIPDLPAKRESVGNKDYQELTVLMAYKENPATKGRGEILD